MLDSPESASVNEFGTVVDPGGSLLLLGSTLICTGVFLTILNRTRILGSLSKFTAEISPQDNRISPKSGTQKHETTPVLVSTRIDLFLQYWWQIIFNTGDARRLFLDKVNNTAANHGFHYGFISYEYLSRLSAVTFFFAVASYLNSLAAVIAGWRTPNIRVMDASGEHELDTRILPDLGHDVLNFVESYSGKWITQALDPDHFLIFCVNSTALFVLAHPKRLLILRRLFAIFGYCNMLRAICVMCTSLPDSSPRCVTQFGNPDTGAYKFRPIFPGALWRAVRLLVSPSEVVTCGDMIFSGHTVAMMLCSLIFAEYCNIEQCNTPLLRMLPTWFPKFLCIGMNFNVGLGLFAILGTRLHYTLDILIAAYITRHAWSIYHRVAVDALQEHEFTHQWSGGMQRMFRWLEAEEIQNMDITAYNRVTTNDKAPLELRTAALSQTPVSKLPICCPRKMKIESTTA